MIWGSIKRRGEPDIINVTWPQRGLFHVTGAFELPDSDITVDVLVWDDCMGDAIESAAERSGCEGARDENVGCRAVTGVERESIRMITDKAIAEETYTP